MSMTEYPNKAQVSTRDAERDRAFRVLLSEVEAQRRDIEALRRRVEELAPAISATSGIQSEWCGEPMRLERGIDALNRMIRKEDVEPAAPAKPAEPQAVYITEGTTRQEGTP